MRALALLLVLGLLVGATPALAQASPPELRADPGRVEMAPGTRFNGEVAIKNTRPTNMTTTLTVDAQSASVFLFNTTVALMPNETKRVGFYLTVPADHAPGFVTVEFRASGAVAYLFVEVADREPQAFDAGLLPATDFTSSGAAIQDGNRYEGRITVTNLNSTTRTFPLRLRVPDGWTPSLSTTSLTLGPRQSAAVDVRAEPGPTAVNGTGMLEIGDPRAHTAVAIYLNVTHNNATKPAFSRLSVDPQTVEVPAAGATAGVRLSIANEGDFEWSGSIYLLLGGHLLVEGPTTALVPPRSVVLLDYVIRTNATLAGGESSVGFFTRDSNATVVVRAPPAPTPANLSVALDVAEVDFLLGERAFLNVTIANDGDEPASGGLVVVPPAGLSLDGDTTFSVPGHANVTLPFSVAARVGVTGPVDGNVTFAAGGSAPATLAVRVRVPPLQPPEPLPVLNVSLDPSALDIEPGEMHLVRVTVANSGDGAWRGQLEIRTFGNATAEALTTTFLDVAPGALAVVNVRVARAGEGEAYARFEALDAQATLVLDDTTRPQVSETEVGGVGAITPPIAAALVAAGVGVAAGGVALGQRRWPLLFAGLYARLAPSRLLEHPMRARIRRLVEESPGVTRNELGRRLGLAPGALDHHLAKLLSGGFVVIVPDGQLRRFFVVGSARPEARAALDERILAHLRAHGPASTSDVAQALGASRQALHYHLRRMSRDGSVVVERGPRGLTLRAP